MKFEGFSKGPWLIEREGPDSHLRSADGDSLMCDMHYYPWTPDKPEDWKLIAAAPDLLNLCMEQQAALQYISDQLDGIDADALTGAELRIQRKASCTIDSAKELLD